MLLSCRRVTGTHLEFGFARVRMSFMELLLVPRTVGFIANKL